MFTHPVDHQKHEAVVSWCSNFDVETSHLAKFPSPRDVPHHRITRAIEEVAGSPALSEGQLIPETEHRVTRVLQVWLQLLQ